MMTETPEERAARLTAECEVDYFWRAPENQRYVARLWCNAIGENVIGYGPTVFAAVLDAHTKHKIETDAHNEEENE